MHAFFADPSLKHGLDIERELARFRLEASAFAAQGAGGADRTEEAGELGQPNTNMAGEAGGGI